MNERIRELALQAGYKPLSPPTFADELNEIFMQKFAELIVRECAKVLTQHGSYFSGEGEPYHYAASLIEEHFGVEE
jgi:hypothetical protein